MSEKIYEVIKNRPGIRKSQISHYVQCSRFSDVFRIAFNSLKDSGKIYYKTFKDPANMELYDMWYAN